MDPSVGPRASAGQPSARQPSAGPPKISLFFSLHRHNFHLSFSLLWSFFFFEKHEILAQGHFGSKVSFVCLFHAAQRMACCGSASGWHEVIRGPHPPSVQWPRAKGVQQQCRRPVVNPVHDPRRRVPEVAPQKPVSTQGPTKISGGDSSECPGFHHPIGERSCVLGRIRRDCSRNFGRLSEANTFPGGNCPCLGSHQVVRGVCASCPEASFASRGGGDRSCGASRAHEGVEEGQRRLANLKAEAQNPPAPVPPVMEMEAEILRLREHVAELEVGCASVSRVLGLGSFRPCQLWCQENSSHRQTDLQEALVSGDTSRVLELTSKMTEGAEHLRELTSSVRMVP